MARKRITKYTICAYTPAWNADNGYDSAALVRIKVVAINPVFMDKTNNRDLAFYVAGMLSTMESAAGNTSSDRCIFCYDSYDEELDAKLPMQYMS